MKTVELVRSKIAENLIKDFSDDCELKELNDKQYKVQLRELIRDKACRFYVEAKLKDLSEIYDLMIEYIKSNGISFQKFMQYSYDAVKKNGIYDKRYCIVGKRDLPKC